MATINPRVNLWIDRALGYLGLFLIGLIGWVCDHFAETRTRERQLRSGHGERAALLRK